MESLISHVDSIILGFVQGSLKPDRDNSNIVAADVCRFHRCIWLQSDHQRPVFRFDLIWHCLKIIILLVIATQWDTFFLFVYNMATDLPSDFAGLLIASAADNAGTEANDEASANLALSQFFDRGMTVSSKLLEGAAWNDFGQYLYAGLVWFGTIGLTGYSTMLIVLSKLAVAILLAVGPIFILLLIFVNTKSLSRDG